MVNNVIYDKLNECDTLQSNGFDATGILTI